MPKFPYPKPALLLDDQLQLLRGRGLEVANPADARRLLENISYYRLSGYTRYYADPADDAQERFLPGVTFDRVIGLYVFDRRLRHLFGEAFERIEVAVKGGVAYHGSILSGPFWMTDPANFDASRHAEIMSLVVDAVIADDGKHKQQFLDHFYRKYADAYPPAWMITEVLSFHGISIVYKLARGTIRRPVADQFGIQQDILESWLHALVFARNLCAHHSRFWNRRFIIRPKIPREYRQVWPAAGQNQLYIAACVIKHMLERLGVVSHFEMRGL
ncbi:MAG: Abi family protein [Brevundimonas sp.]|uniref:Abi family protein n=1 Tax=Brevundimonas sp. TaxID=1871086 RepID=UPI0027256927|nr:Abi family protein [Brevundimonas sp.]MDO9586840.1 Abi family protein [Brevundimonas sp.]